MMTKEKRSFLVWSVTAACMAWMALVGWLMFALLPPGAVEHHGSTAVKDRMATQCQGSFRDRYECKEAIIVETGRDTFFNLAGRFLAVILPPLLLSAWLSSYLRRNPVRLNHHRLEEGGDWKSRAQAHTKPAAAHHPASEPAFGGDGHEPDSSPRPFTLDEIAPVDDWKTRAQNKTRHH
jgi:hypothetical protein